jgi:putative cell wall-binding protein
VAVLYENGFSRLTSENARLNSWSSSNEDVATVNSYGVIRAHKTGRTVITLEKYEATESFELEVKEPEVTAINLSSPYNKVNVGQFFDLDTDLKEIGNRNSNPYHSVTFSSSNQSIAEVNSYGRVRPRSEGHVILTAEAGGKSESIVLTIGNPSTSPPTPPSNSTSQVNVRRIFGDTRFETAVKISQQGWTQADTVVIANSHNYVDALAGVPLAYQLDAPILLARGSSLDAFVRDEIKRLGAEKAVILGGGFAVSQEIENELENLGLQTSRLAGETRFETALSIAKEVQRLTGSNQVVIANSHDFPDALSIAPFAAQKGYPIVLSRNSGLEPEVLSFVKNFEQTLLIGGEHALGSNVSRVTNKPTLLAGETRYNTNVEILNYFNVESSNIAVATGNGFADALTGSVLAAKQESGIALVNVGVNNQLKEFIQKNNITDFELFGGVHAVTQRVENELNGLYK